MKVLLLVCAAALAFGQNEDLAHGRKLYEGFCSLCHGQTGTGGKGPSLAQPTLQRAPDGERLVEIIRQGIRGTEMPGAWQLTEHEAQQVAMYVRALGRTPEERLPGDGVRGKALYNSNGCSGCHIIRGAGSSLGPELSEIGARRSSTYLRTALLDPGAALPEGFVVVSVTTGGRTIRGMRITEDTFTIQLRDASGKLHSFRKSELAKISREPHGALMPSYQGKLSNAELDDLIAYLASLR